MENVQYPSVDPIARVAAVSRKQRPLSRASTMPIGTLPTQSNLDHAAYSGPHDVYPSQWQSHHQHKSISPVSHQIPPEDLILQAASQLQASADFGMDSSSLGVMAHAMAFQQQQQQQHHAQQHQPQPQQHQPQHHQQQQQPQQQQQQNLPKHPLPTHSFATSASFTETDSQMMDRDEMEEGDSQLGASASQKGSSRSSANNELEMRNLFNANKQRSLEDVAGELHGNDRGPHSERARQIFAMLWINQVCTKGKGSVPRGRVYANYATRCGNERITVLNPASFGKLVRVLFPGLKTRRLGVRGESKYHYVNFMLREETPEAREPTPRPAVIEAPKSFTYILPAQPQQQSQQQQLQPQQQQQLQLQQPQQQSATSTEHNSVEADHQPALRHSKTPERGTLHEKTHSLYNKPDLSRMDMMETTATKTQLGLAFPCDSDEPFNSEAIALPAIEPFLPPGTDRDAAKSLSALYRSHCTSLVECIRYCKEKSFFHLYTSFQGTLTMPVQKLFGKPSIAPWIEQCDCIVYQRMMKIISSLTLQVLPHPVLDTLKSIAEHLVSHVRQSFQGQPQHVIAAKEAPATIFAGLIDRALRVNLTAHAAANMLSNPLNRNQMYLDWVTTIRVRKIAETVRPRAMDDVVKLLVNEIKYLLNPTNIAWEVEIVTVYGDVPARERPANEVDDAADAFSGQNVLDRWVALLKSLPERFPYASHAEIVWCVERVGTTVMRDLTISQGKSFGSWWVTKTWIDEMVWFLAEQGAFSKLKTTQASVDSADTEAAVEDAGKHWAPSTNGLSHDRLDLSGIPGSNLELSQPDRAPFPMPSDNSNNNHHSKHSSHQGMPEPSHDDSGFGSEEDFRLDGHNSKYGMPQPDSMTTSQLNTAM